MENRVSNLLRDKKMSLPVLAGRDIVPLYEEASPLHIVDEMLYGMEAVILEEAGDFARVRTDYRYEGYARKTDLRPGNWKTVWKEIPEEIKKEQFPDGFQKTRIQRNYADVLSLSKVQGLQLAGVARGGVLLRGKTDENGWTAVVTAEGKIGYTKESYLGEYRFGLLPKQLEETSFRENVVETAKKYMGTQYRWGGKSPFGIDCSGLCSMAYLINGVVIWRDAKMVDGFPVHPIRPEDRKPGDLLYFPGHIAMEIGEGFYIHSTGKNQSDGVVINSMDPESPLFREDLPAKLYAVGSIF